MKNSGFSLIELVITTTIVAILAGIALPSFDRQIKATQIRSTSAQLVESLNLARLTAVTKGQRVVVRPSPNWSSGWQVFIDNNSDGVLSTNESLMKEFTVPSTVSIVSNAITANKYISYVGSGASETVNGAFLAATLWVCSRQAHHEGMAIKIRYGGRVRTEKVSASACKAA